MTAQLLVRQGGGAAAEVDIANLDPDDYPAREGVPFFDHNTSLIMLGQRWEQGTASQGSFTYIDPHATHTHQFRPHATVKLVEASLSPDAILAYGRIEGGNDTRRRSSTIAGDEVEHSSIGFMDCNIDLRGLPFATEWVRPAEDSWDRLQALHAAKLNGSDSTSPLHRATTNLGCDRFTNGHLVDATDPVDLAAKTYPVGTTVEEIMMDIMEEWGKGWGITIHHGDVNSHRCILVQDLDDLTTFTSELRISDDPADWAPDHGSAPTKEPHWRHGDGKQLENSHVISGLISIYSGTPDDPDHLTVETGEAPDDWEVWWDVYQDDLAKGIVPATRRANNILNDRKRPYTTNMPSILLNPNQVKLITAGQAIEVKSVVMNQGALKHTWVWRRIAQIDWEPSVDGRWWAHLELDRPRGSRPRAGGSQPGSTSPKPPPDCTPVPDDVVTVLSDSAAGDWGATVTTGSCWGGDPHKSIGGSGMLSPTISVSAGDVIRASLNFRDETGDDAWENNDNYNYDADLQFMGPSLPTLTYKIVNTRYHNAGCIDVNHARSETVPTGYTSARVKVNSRLGGYQFNGTISEVDPADVPDNDEFCVIPGSGGSSPFYARSDDTRFEADDQHLTTKAKQRVVNNSGGLLEAGDIVIPDVSYDGQGVTTTTTANQTASRVGVIESDVADGETGVVIWEGTFIGDIVINDGASTSADGDYLYTSTTAGAAGVNASRSEGAVGQVIRDNAGDPAYVTWWGNPDQPDQTGGGGNTTVVYKAADEIVNNSAVLQNDNDLVTALGASEEWEFELNGWFTSGTTPDIKFTFTVPTGAVIYWSRTGLAVGGTSDNDAPVVTASGTTHNQDGQGTSTVRHFRLKGYVRTTGTSGNLQFQWAQNTQNASDTTLLRGSALKLFQLA